MKRLRLKWSLQWGTRIKWVQLFHLTLITSCQGMLYVDFAESSHKYSKRNDQCILKCLYLAYALKQHRIQTVKEQFLCRKWKKHQRIGYHQPNKSCIREREWSQALLQKFINVSMIESRKCLGKTIQFLNSLKTHKVSSSVYQPSWHSIITKRFSILITHVQIMWA
mgnify:FL=1